MSQRLERVLVVGATGVIGAPLAQSLARTAGVITASRTGSQESVDITDPRSLTALFERVGHVDAVICVAGQARFVPWSDVSGEDWAHGVSSKLLGQVNLTLIAAPWVRDGGSVTLTSGVLAQHPMPGSSIVTTVNSAIEGFVRAAAGEIGQGVRVNAVSPGWIKESMQAMGMDPTPGLSAADVAAIYAGLLTSPANGTTVVAAKEA